MTQPQFIAACKNNGVNIKRIIHKRACVVIYYNYDLPNNTLSSTYKSTYTYIDNVFQSIYNDCFAAPYIRF